MKKFNSARKIIGQRLFNIALAWSVNPNGRTKKAMREEIKNCSGRKKAINGSKSIETAFSETFALANAIYAQRKINLKSKTLTKLGKPGVWETSLEVRLKQYKTFKLNEAIKETSQEFEANYRCDQSPVFKPIIDSYFDEANKQRLLSGGLIFTQSEILDWDYYSKSCKYPKKLVQNHFSFSKRYIKNIVDKNIAVLDGLITLSATKIENDSSCDLYEAQWLSQARGYALKTVNGFIAVKDDLSFHGKTMQSALNGLNKKLKNVTLTDVFDKGLKHPSIISIIEKYGDLKVTKQDAIKAGACISGTRSWCNRVGIDYDNLESCTVKEVYEAYKQLPRPEVAAILLKTFNRKSITL